MKTKFKVYSDAGHGWVAVKRVLLEQLSIADKITSYSYQKGATVYLEEDQDATTFIGAFAAKFGKKPEFDEIDHGNESKIRSYPTYEVVNKGALV